MANLLFYALSLLTISCAALVVWTKNAVNAAMFLLVTLAGVAGLFVLLDAALLAFVLLLVYAGAVVALFLFIIMLLDTRHEALKPFRPMTIAASTIGAALLLLGLVTMLRRAQFPAPVPDAIAGSSLKPYAEQLFTTYLLPVQIVGFLLLAAMLGVIVLSRKHEPREETP
ncbi:MAG TPA: NADH-quinone oxidoreductase subunit J [Candidatus Didemnitutus sp.]|jgi:NADH-quinone oxidoreductase subunit J